MDCSLLGSFVHGIFQARVLEWVAIAFSIGHMGQEQKQGLRLQHLASLFPAYWAQTPLPI